VAEIVWTDEARRWLQEIYSYIAEHNEEAAWRTVTGIHQRAEILLQFPEIGYRHSERPTVRVLLYGHYRIAYLTASNGDVQILGVFHGAMDLRRYLRPPQ
jgi:toxin ParE1/3/4